MSYDQTIYFGVGGFQQDAYQSFVSNSVRTLGVWHQETYAALDLTRDRCLHGYYIREFVSKRAEADWELGVGVSVELRHNETATGDVKMDRFQYCITVETGAGRSPLSMAIQFAVVASSFTHFHDAIVIDDQSDDPNNAVTYSDRESFLRHTARVFSKTFDWSQVHHQELLDDFLTGLRQEVKHDVFLQGRGSSAGGA